MVKMRDELLEMCERKKGKATWLTKVGKAFALKKLKKRKSCNTQVMYIKLLSNWRAHCVICSSLVSCDLNLAHILPLDKGRKHSA